MRHPQCSFCGKREDQVRQLIVGPGVYICDECVDLCQQVLRDKQTRAEPGRPSSELETRAESNDEPIRGSLSHEVLRAGLVTLSARHRRILELRYGLIDEVPRTLEQVGRTLGLTPERIRELETESLKMLRSSVTPGN